MTPSDRLDRHLDPRADIFVPLSVLYADDLAVARVSAHAELVWVRGLVMARGRVTDGRVSTRAMIGYLYGKLTADEVTAAIAELTATDPPLWLSTDDPDVQLIRTWAKHHEPVDEVVGRRAAQRAGGAKGNHLRHHVRGKAPNPDCPLCVVEGLAKPANEQVVGTDSVTESPPESVGRSVGESVGPRGGDSQEVEVEGEVDNYLQSLQERLGTESGSESGTDGEQPQPAHHADRVTADILAKLGYVNPRTEHTQAMTAAVTKALANGHRAGVIHAKATAAEIANSTGATPARRALGAIEQLIATAPEPNPMAGIDDEPADVGPWPKRTERSTELIKQAKSMVRPQPENSEDQ